MEATVLPGKVLQFGGGNFLRGFVDFLINKYNRATHSDIGVIAVKVTPRGDYSEWKAQDGLYHVITKGIADGELVNETDLVSCISSIIHAYNEWDKYLETATSPDIRFVISNTTESGLRISEDDKNDGKTPDSFPAKLTVWLYRRFQHFNGSKASACIIIPCELLVENGKLLKSLILELADKWNLGQDFKDWIDQENIFCDTLVDRIVPGVQKDRLNEVWEELDYEDHLVTEGEPYHIWAIEAPETVAHELPLNKAGLNVVFTDDLTPYRKRKVRILNGSHTALVPVAYLSGLRIVRDTVHSELMGVFLRRIIDNEILPALDMPQDELRAYADTIIDRFSNPYIDHYLISISLNSFSKFKARLLPTMTEFVDKYNKLPVLMVFSFTCLIRFYKGEYDGEKIELKDEPEVLDKMNSFWDNHPFKEIIHEVLTWSEFWGKDLTTIPDLEETMYGFTEAIEELGVKSTLRDLLNHTPYL